MIFYGVYTGDSTAASSLNEEEVDERVKLFIEMEDPEIVIDLRELNTGHHTKYDVFWEECQKFLQENIGLAVDERRHTNVTHMARAISARDLLDQVSSRCPPNTPIPSQSWLSLQFWPKSVHSHSKIHYTGRFNVKYMVQARQFRKDHEDSHYAAAIFRYQREYAVMMREHSAFVCLDDKHKVKVGEPGHPVAAVERGKRVLVRRDESFEVADHDFTKFSLIPSVTLDVNIPEEVSGTWYSGQVYIGLKEGVFEPSSPQRHVTELKSCLSATENKPVLFVYSDGGPDHRLTYLSVKLSLISIFLELDLDFLCACRTAPSHSWRNPAERVMSIVNLGLQCVGIMREKMDDSYEQQVDKCNNMAQLRRLAAEKSEVMHKTLDSVAPIKVLLTDILQRLKLDEAKFKVFLSASEEEIKQMFSNLLDTVDTSLEYGAKLNKEYLQSHPAIVSFMQHCCQARHYSFCIKKCGDPSCTTCKPVRLSSDIFQMLRFIPDPVPGDDHHYLPFTEAFTKKTSEEHRPSLKNKPKKKSLPFTPSVQHVKNVNMVIQCEECEMWRVVYSKYKLKPTEKKVLQQSLDGMSYTCGAILADLHLTGKLSNVHVRDLRCYDPMEKLYYSSGCNDQVCYYCSCTNNLHTVGNSYPICTSCKKSKDPVLKRT